MSSNRYGLPKDYAWVLVKAFVAERGLVRQHLDSYNHFIEHTLQKIVDEIGEIHPDIPNVYVKLGKIYVGEPRVREADGSESQATPMVARLRNLTYSAPIYLEMSMIIDGEESEPVKAYIGEMPIMVKSIKCPLYMASEEELIKLGEDPRDPGGYFIINGSERVLIMQEDLAINKVLVERMRPTSSVTHVAKVYSTRAGQRASVTVERTKDGMLHVNVAGFPGRIPLLVLMKALGLETDRDIMNAITDDEEIIKELLPVFIEQGEIAPTVERALDYLGSRLAIAQPKAERIRRAEEFLDRQLLPHIGSSSTQRIAKAYFIGQMVEKLLELYLGRREPDDKDHYGNKRLKLAGELMEMVFRRAFRSFASDLSYEITKLKYRVRDLRLVTLVRADLITNKLLSALSTGNWVGGRTGVSQILDRTNYISALSHLRRVVSPLSRTQPHFEARELHPTQWGRICPVESPEGQNCGLVKNLALLASISIGIDEEEIYRKLIEDLGVIEIRHARENGIKGSKVILNGRLIGVHPDGKKLAQTIRQLRRQGLIHHEVNVAHIAYDMIDEVYINCDAGRVRRPLIIVENGEPKLKPEHVEKLRNGEWTWSDLVSKGIIEYLDADEEEDAYIAPDLNSITKEHTHVEITPAAMLGIVASIIPFTEHNQSPRNVYGAAMGKQALGISGANFRLRMDPRMHLLHYPQKPLVTTKVIDLLELDKRPAGQNFIVAVLTGGGYNIQDAVIINKASVERGLARSTFFRTYETEERKYAGGQEDRIEIPPEDIMDRRPEEAYEKLDAADGIAPPEAEVSGGEVIVGKTSPPRFFGAYEYRPVTKRRDTSIALRHGEKGIVDRVIIAASSEGTKLVKIRVRDPRIPELGDKFASRHGQKGVIGLIMPQEDMPFTEDGIVPDLLINPHAIPSRMTIGQLLESLAGKVAALQGSPVDATAFEGVSEETLKEALKKLGFRSDGKEVMYNGITGEKLEAEIFIGVVYYQKLHHMVADKMHARARGPVQILTRQPTEGRAREGGLRFGEMEKDCLVGHGAAMLLRERLFESADKTVVYVCENCGFIGYFDARRNVAVCPICKERGSLHRISMSYAFKLLLQELTSMLIAPRIILKDKVEVV